MNRTEILTQLIDFNGSLHSIRENLKKLDWDVNNDDIVIFSKTHIVNVMEKLKQRKISYNELTEWANLIECREDIEFMHGEEEFLHEFIFNLANPTLSSMDYMNLLKSYKLQ